MHILLISRRIYLSNRLMTSNTLLHIFYGSPFNDVNEDEF